MPLWVNWVQRTRHAAQNWLKALLWPIHQLGLADMVMPIEPGFVPVVPKHAEQTEPEGGHSAEHAQAHLAHTERATVERDEPYAPGLHANRLAGAMPKIKKIADDNGYCIDLEESVMGRDGFCTGEP